VKRQVLTEDALRDFEQIYEYIAKDNPTAADRHREKLKAHCRVLLDQPRIGSKRSDIRPDMRSISEGSYVIYYRPIDTGIEIVRVLHGSQDPQRAFAEAERQKQDRPGGGYKRAPGTVS
jgi:toxin ParE1/3/4